MMNLSQVPKETLRKILMKGSMHMVRALIMADPKCFGTAFMNVLASSVRPETLSVLIEQVNRGTMLTPEQVESAHHELEKLLREEQVVS